MPEPVSPVCSRFHRAVELIGGRWTGAIIRTLLHGRTRYATIKAAIPDITDRMLSERLRSLETEGLVTRTVLPESPVRVEYELTEKGSSLQKALDELGAWAERWMPADDTQFHLSGPVNEGRKPAPEPEPASRRGPRIRAR
ncbi:MAG TPA: helix-turn-helix domain-containing protein [Gemmatimonadaceae bacterium]|nr:helix-turn-helix domain-containing protein [Gemmatimonadaceae bacterium]